MYQSGVEKEVCCNAITIKNIKFIFFGLRRIRYNAGKNIGNFDKIQV